MNKNILINRVWSHSAMFLIFFMSSEGWFLSIRPQTLFTTIYFGFFCYSIRYELISEFYFTMFIFVAQMSKILNPKFEDFSAMRALALVVIYWFWHRVMVFNKIIPSLLDNNDCPVSVFYGFAKYVVRGCAHVWGKFEKRRLVQEVVVDLKLLRL